MLTSFSHSSFASLLNVSPLTPLLPLLLIREFGEPKVAKIWAIAESSSFKVPDVYTGFKGVLGVVGLKVAGNCWCWSSSKLSLWSSVRILLWSSLGDLGDALLRFIMDFIEEYNGILMALFGESRNSSSLIGLPRRNGRASDLFFLDPSMAGSFVLFLSARQRLLDMMWIKTLWQKFWKAGDFSFNSELSLGESITKVRIHGSTFVVRQKWGINFTFLKRRVDVILLKSLGALKS